ncbi:MAG: hypothetical protein V3R84_04810 [Acidimicrobiia bacterium]
MQRHYFAWLPKRRLGVTAITGTEESSLELSPSWPLVVEAQRHTE